jgi:hypothetical protein
MEQARSKSDVPDGPLTYPNGRNRRAHARSTKARAVNAALSRGEPHRTPGSDADDESTHPEASPEEDWCVREQDVSAPAASAPLWGLVAGVKRFDEATSVSTGRRPPLVIWTRGRLPVEAGARPVVWRESRGVR